MSKGKSTRRYNKSLISRKHLLAFGDFLFKPNKNGLVTNRSINNLSELGEGTIKAAGTAVGLIGGSLIGGGFQSGAGNVLQGLSGIASAIPGPWGAVASAGLGVLGGITNRMFGSKMNTLNINKVEANINSLNNFQSSASNFDTLSQNWANADTGMTFSDDFIGKDGWLGNKAKNKAADLRKLIEAGNAWVLSSLINNAENIGTTQMLNLLANYSAQGGYINRLDDGGYTWKDGATDALANEVLILNSRAFGGELGTNGADFTNGIILINSGGTHELNPNEGVIFGMDLEGVPNLVEEGEVIFRDYVFSNRIKVPKAVRKKHRLTDGITFSDAAKELAKESEERPNDPISQNGLEYLMNDLITELEMIKAKREKNKFSKGGRVNKYPYGTLNLSLLDREVNRNDFSWMDELNEEINTNNTNNSKKTSKIANLRYIPAIGAAIGTTTDLFKLTNKPDYEPADMVLEASKGIGAATPIRFNTIGNYLTYKPFDRNYYINKLNALSGASRRLLNNSGMSSGAKAAAILAADNNYINLLGSLARLAEEYNLAQRQQIENFNRATNLYNSEGILKANMTNLENRLKLANLRMESTLAGAKMRLAAKDASDLAKSTNLTNLFDSLGNIGWEEYQRNSIESNPALSGYYQSRTGNIGYNPKRARGGYLTIKKRRK